MAAAELTEKQRAALDELMRRRGSLTPLQQKAIDELNRRALGRPQESIRAAPSQEGRAAPSPEPLPSFIETVGTSTRRGAIAFGEGFNEDLAGTLGLPVDMATTALNAGFEAVGLPKIEKPFGGSESIREALPSSTLPGGEGALTDLSPLERILQRAGGEVGATVSLLGGTLKIAGTAQQGIQIARSLPQQIIQDLSRVDPRTLAAIETGLAASAGTGAGVLREIFPEGGPIVDLVGELIGAFGPQATVRFIQKAKEIAGGLIGPVTKDLAERGVGQELSRSTADEFGLESKIERAEKVGEEIPGFEPTLGQASDDPGLIAKERAFERKSGEKAGKFAQRRRDNQTAVRDFLEEEAPQGKLSEAVTGLEAQQAFRQQALDQGLFRAQARLDTAKNRVSQRTERVLADAERRFQQAEQRVQTQLEAVRPTLTDAGAGRIIRREYLKELEAFREQAGRFYDEIRGDLVLVGSQELKLDVADLASFNPATQRAQDFPLAMIERINALPGAVTFTELRELRSTLKAELREARAGANPNDQLAMRLNTLLDKLELHISEQVQRLFPDEFAKFQDANEFYQKGVARLKRGTIARLRRKDVTGNFTTPDEEAAFLFLDGETPVKDFVQAVGSRPEARRALEDAARLDFFEKAVPDGRTVNPDLAQRWIRQHQDILNEFPELRQNLGSAALAQQELNAVRKQTEQIKRDPERFSRLIGGREFGDLDAAERRIAKVQQTVTRTRKSMEKSSVQLFLGEDADRAATKILTSGNPIARYSAAEKQLAANPVAKRGLQRAMWDAMLDRFESRAVDGLDRPILQARAMRDFLETNEALIIRMFGEERWRRLRRVREAMEIIERTGRVPSPGGSDTAINLGTLVRDAGPILSRLYANQRRIISLKWIIGERAARTLAQKLQQLSERQIDAVFEEAFFNPQLANALISSARGAPITTKQLNLFLANMNQLDTNEQ